MWVFPLSTHSQHRAWSTDGISVGKGKRIRLHKLLRILTSYGFLTTTHPAPPYSDYMLIFQTHQMLGEALLKKLIKTGTACVEPCSFRTCMNSCRHNMDEPHTDHYCRDHAKSIQEKTEQLSIEDQPVATESWLQAIQRQVWGLKKQAEASTM